MSALPMFIQCLTSIVFNLYCSTPREIFYSDSSDQDSLKAPRIKKHIKFRAQRLEIFYVI